MAEHENRHRPQSYSQPRHEGQQVSAEEFVGAKPCAQSGDDSENQPIDQRALLDGFHHRRRHQVGVAQGSRAHFGSSVRGLVSAGSTTGRVAPEPSSLNCGGSEGTFCPARNVGGGGCLAQLQSADVGHNGPAILRRDLRRVVGHGTEAVGDHVEQISQRRLAQTLNVIRRRLAREATRWNHAVAIAHAGMTGSAINVVALLSAGQKFVGDRKGHVVSGIVADLSGIEIGVFVQLAAGDRALDRRTRRTQVGIEIARGQRLEARLVVHILTAAGQGQERCQQLPAVLKARVSLARMPNAPCIEWDT